MVFQDSDLAKWLEAVSYRLMSDPDAELEKTVDDIISLIGRPSRQMVISIPILRSGNRRIVLRICVSATKCIVPDI